MNRSFPHLNVARMARWTSALLLIALVLAACAPAATAVPTDTAVPPTAVPPTAVPTAVIPVTGATSAPAAMEATINIVTDPKYGKILVDGKGMTLYMFTKDAPGKSNCSGGCAKAWPPLLTQGSPTLGAGVDASLVGSADLADGTKIVTYNKMPLYYFAKDAAPGDIKGLGVGGVWFLVSADGKITGAEATINVATDPKYGKILVDGKGMALYVYTKDTPGVATCTGGCAAVWPPLRTSGSPTLGAGVDASMIGSADLADGTKIITYNKMPLYYYAKDAKPGDVTGMGVGGVWFLLGPDGKLIQSASSGTGY